MSSGLEPAQQPFAAQTSSVAAARRFLTSRLEQWGRDDLVWVGQLVVSELATNAVLHAGTSFTICVRTLPDGAVRLEVADGAQRAPRERQYGPEATTGRGVGLVAELTRTWGVDQRPDGKTVWCELVAGPDASGPQDDAASALPPEIDVDAFLGADDLAEPASTREADGPGPTGGRTRRALAGAYRRPA